MKRNKRYVLNRATVVALILVAVICLICYGVLSFQINIRGDMTIERIAGYETFKDILLVVISTIGVSLLSNVLIECRSQNKFLMELMANEVISSPEFYERMDEESKKKMYAALEYDLFSQNRVLCEMYRSMRDKLSRKTDRYYYTKCAYSVTCTVYDDYIEKSVTRVTHLRSYQKNYTLKDYKIISYSSKAISGHKAFEKKSLKINNVTIDASKCEERQGKDAYNMDEQSEYDCFVDYIYKPKLRISSEEDTIITMVYTTRTTIDDKMSTFRVSYPCQSFSLHFSIKPEDKYRVVGAAYGFLDDADNSINDTSKTNLTLEFDDWIFKHDGVTVVILDVNN